MRREDEIAEHFRKRTTSGFSEHLDMEDSLTVRAYCQTSRPIHLRVHRMPLRRALVRQRNSQR